ncbi:aminotransferase class I/II-fold pyridoxal phosphate-dependent enzyme [Ktedonosporobacter rubrisoli]|uniref:Aminotransferase n=1 Tax=Ktedonosporobacter rubrisoli TaxID=2509675 RepID=A0A4P6K1K0_KTERU|nr:LL-diaminopimelate aminotransferase [Ktedonosporobacter rubrisoli]QBD81959.1 aminotransferase class I/II-fold pyridoxal phosphate-dependent enzyme [Ktedonosporobacter rubrisoli]
MQLSKLVSNLPPYHFAGVQKKLNERKAAGVDVISLSTGDPDLPAPAQVVERLCSAMQDPENHRYPEYRGMRALHEAIAAWFERRFGVQLTPERDILPLIGSKEGLAYAAMAVLNAGDVALIPDPYYPVYITGSTNVGAEPYMLPLLEQDNYLPDLESIPPHILKKARLLWLNYPNNPTAGYADRAFFEHVVEFARRHNIVIVHDMAYAEVYFDDFRPMSILEVEGANEVAVELHSLSKTYNMAGFRIGMLVGNHELVDAIGRLKSNIDTGIFRPIQYAAIEALNLPASWIEQRNVIYRRRRDLLLEGCNAIGMRAGISRAGLYIWAAIPQGFTSREFTDWLFEQTGVLVAPGSNFGPRGEGYVRIAMTSPDERIEAALERMKAVVAK